METEEIAKSCINQINFCSQILWKVKSSGPDQMQNAITFSYIMIKLGNCIMKWHPQSKFVTCNATSRGKCFEPNRNGMSMSQIQLFRISITLKQGFALQFTKVWTTRKMLTLWIFWSSDRSQGLLDAPRHLGKSVFTRREQDTAIFLGSSEISCSALTFVFTCVVISCDEILSHKLRFYHLASTLLWRSRCVFLLFLASHISQRWTKQTQQYLQVS